MDWPGRRVTFWEQVTPKLDALGLDLSERAKIKAQLDRVMPRPSAEEWAEVKRVTAEQREMWQFAIDNFVKPRRRGPYVPRGRSA
jgi:hypothetical protein